MQPEIFEQQDAPKNTGTDLKLTVGADGTDMRLDVWLSQMLSPDVSRARLQALIKQGCVQVDRLTARAAKQKLVSGQVIDVALPPPVDALPRGEAIELDILYEDNAVIVLNKPAGLIVHPGAGNPDGTLVNALIHHCGDSLSGIGGVKRPGIVHRLDRLTSGVMVVAKHDAAHRHLSAQFADHGREGELKREYTALVWGTPTQQTGRIETYLGRAKGHRTHQAVVNEGQADARFAITHYRVEKQFANGTASQIACRLETGRTHQIRVHMAYLGHPVVGDADYGAGFATKVNKLPGAGANAVKALHRQALHARLLAFAHPVSNEVMCFDAPLPSDMQAVIDGLM